MAQSDKKSATFNQYEITIEDSSIVVTHNGEVTSNTKEALRKIASECGFDYDDKWTTRQFGSELVNFLNVRDPQYTLTKKVTLKLWGSEIEWDFYNEDGDNDESYGCLLCKDPGDITIYVDDEELDGGNVKAEHSNHTNTLQLDENIVGIYENDNKAAFACEIEVQGEFDLSKLSYKTGRIEIVSGDEIIQWFNYTLISVIYDGTEYNVEWQESRNKGSELIWGYDPNEDEDYEEDEDDCDDEVLSNLKKDFKHVWKFNNGLYLIEKKNRLGFADCNGKILIKPKYENVEDDFVEDMIVVQDKDFFGYVNSKGQEVVPPKFIGAGNFKNGRAFVIYNDNECYIDLNGNFIED